jgi:hypothetical protein
LLVLLREYWGIESGLHDATRLTVGESGQNMAILNNLALGLCFSGTSKNLASICRNFDAHPFLALRCLFLPVHDSCECRDIVPKGD